MLTKPPLRTYHPGSPEIPYQPARTVCTPQPPSGGPVPPGGGWVTVCTTIQILIGYDNGPASWDNPGPFPKPIYITALTCRSVWRPG